MLVINGKVLTLNKCKYLVWKFLDLSSNWRAYIQTWLGCMFELSAYEDKNWPTRTDPFVMQAVENF